MLKLTNKSYLIQEAAMREGIKVAELHRDYLKTGELINSKNWRLVIIGEKSSKKVDKWLGERLGITEDIIKVKNNRVC